MTTTQHNFATTEIITDGLSLPDARSLPLGTILIQETTGRSYYVVRGGGGMHIWMLSGSGAAGPPFPATEIVFGSGTGLASDPHFVWNSASAALVVYDMAGVPLFSTNGTALNRSAFFRDAANVAMVEMFSRNDGTRKFDLLDENATAMLHVSLWSSTRILDALNPFGISAMRIDTSPGVQNVHFRDDSGRDLFVIDELGTARSVAVSDDTGAPFVIASALAATRTFAVVFPTTSFGAFSVNTRPATAGVTCNDVADNMVFYVDERVASRHAEFGAPAQFAPYTLATLPPVVDSQQIWVSDGHKLIDPPGPGTGTGVMAYGSLLPVPAWRVFSTDLPVA